MKSALQQLLPKLVLAPTTLILVVCVYGFIGWTALLSFTKSRMMPQWDFIGLDQYIKLFDNPRWMVALENLGAFCFFFILISLLLGVVLAIFLDQKIRSEGALRTIYLYPMAVSFIVTGTAWKWILNPGLGIEKLIREIGFQSFEFRWLIDSEMAIYTIVIAAVWQSSGFVMAIFLAGLRGVDESLINAAEIDGAPHYKIYTRVVLPILRPVFFSAIVILLHIAIKSFDLVQSLTGGGPGYSSDMPANFMYTHAFNRAQMGLGAASAMVMLFGILAVIVPYLYSELREKNG
ncbi:MAG: sugar ABC transporter permease [Arenicellales bacterium]|nr:ABC transporter permease [Acidiferrobacteraceae bacterium]MDP6123247.1 sugar ABC transporter permease [Arenicellales bacterium]MDP6289298.1 sugar ABC transporter permease [Arenicellales bacterium]MDP7156502.1 sugar ABC transporter permease [Arenicellales bacterium]MDP7482563.1 sugar ABC transporter permease [Arenicellales bacterium]